MKFIIPLLTIFLICQTSMAQDYFEITIKDDHATYTYPENAEITLIDSAGTISVIQKNEAITLNGGHTLSIKVPWREKPEILKSGGGTLEIVTLQSKSHDYEKKENRSTAQNGYTKKFLDRPYLEKKEIVVSKENSKTYNLLATFTNGLVFKYEDGSVRAWQDGTEIEISNHYLVQTPQGLLKLSFDQDTGEFWYTFDR